MNLAKLHECSKDIRSVYKSHCFSVFWQKSFGKYSLKNKVYAQMHWKQGFRHICPPIFITALFNIGQKVEAIQMSEDGWMNKENVAHTHNRALFSLTKVRELRHMLEHGQTLKTLC